MNTYFFQTLVQHYLNITDKIKLTLQTSMIPIHPLKLCLWGLGKCQIPSNLKFCLALTTHLCAPASVACLSGVRKRQGLIPSHLKSIVFLFCNLSLFN